MNLRFLYFLSVLFCLCGNLQAQKKDKTWLLVDSIYFEKLTKPTQFYLDSVLTLYHAAKIDTVKLELLTLLSENIEENNIWVKYNRLAYELACKGGEQKVFLHYKANALNNMGYYAHTIGDTKGAVDFYSQALTLREKIKDKIGISNSLNNLGYLFDDLGDSEKAEEYYTQGLTIREELNDRQGMVNSLNNLGAIYYLRKNYQKAISFHERSLKIARELNYKRGIGYALNNLGNVYREMGDLKKALFYQEEALPYRLEISDAAGLSGTYYNFASIYEEMHQLQKAEDYGLKALTIAKDAHHSEKTREAAHLLFGIYRAEKKFEKALEMFIMFIQIRDSTNNENTRKASVKQQFKYEFEKKEAVLKAEQEKKNALAAEDSRRQKIFITFTLAIALVILAVALFVMRSLRITKKQKRIIEMQKHVVEEKQKEILDSIHYAKRIQKALLPSEKFIARNIKSLGKSK